MDRECFCSYKTFFLFLLVVGSILASVDTGITRNDFPPGFIFGAGSSAYTSYDLNCSEGDSTREPYQSAHNILLAHASAAALYKEKYQAVQGGKIGITLLGFWIEPFTGSQEDIVAARKVKDFHLGWFLDPLIYGNYPPIMRDIVGSRLPSFDAEESKRLKESFDFIGFNHYCVLYVQSYPNNFDKNHRDYIRDVSVTVPNLPTGALGKVFTMIRTPPFPSTPGALQEMLEYVKVKYGNPPIMIHENGYGEFDIGPTTGNGTDDDSRVTYLQEYMESVLHSIRNGSNTLGYFVWSFVDCFELMYGYTARYGLYGVDFSQADRRRYPRLSAQWYSNFLSNGALRSQASNTIHTE